MQQILREKTATVVGQLYGEEMPAEKILVNLPPKEFSCDFSVVIFPIAKRVKKSPDAAAREIGEALKKLTPEIESTEVVKGFLNIRLTDAYWIAYLRNAISPMQFPETGKTMMVEYCGPNTNKPLHLGHLRNIFIGYSMANILKAAGNKVVKVNIYNDRGVHICKSMLAYQKYGGGKEPEKEEKGDHFVGGFYVRYEKELKEQVAALVAGGLSEDAAKKQAPLALEVQDMLRKWEAGDPEVRALWKKMNTWVLQGFEQTYRTLHVDFDKSYFESDTYRLGKSIVEQGAADGFFIKKPDGSIWIDLTADGLDEKLLLRADGTSVYITQDIATANERWNDFHPAKMIYTIATEQDYHMKVLQLICKKLNLPFADGIFHLSYGMIDLPEGRMKSREGTVVDADNLIAEMVDQVSMYSKENEKVTGFTPDELLQLYEQLALGALKFFILKVDARKRIIFNPAESIDLHGFTGPFIQYTYARIKSLLRKAAAAGASNNTGEVNELKPQERAIIILLQRYPLAISEAAAAFDPSVLANYVFHLAKAYNHFYQELPILNADSAVLRDFRLQLSDSVASVLAGGLKLLGIQAPESM